MPSHSSGSGPVVALSICIVVLGASAVVVTTSSEIEPPPVVVFEIERVSGEVVTSLVFSPDDRFLLATYSQILYGIPAIRSRRLALIDRETSARVAVFERTFIGAACFSPPGDAFFFLSTEGIERYDIDTARLTLFASPRSVCRSPGAFAIGITLDGQTVGVHDPYRDDRFYAWSDASGRYVDFDRDGAAWNSGLHGYASSRDGKLFVCGPTPRVYDLTNDTRVGYCMREEVFGPNCAAFSPDNSELICVYDDGVLVVWDLTTADGQAATELFRTYGLEGVIEIEISNDGEWLACGLDDGSVELRRFSLPSR